MNALIALRTGISTSVGNKVFDDDGLLLDDIIQTDMQRMSVPKSK
ncbi:hypothetical protein OTK51_21070 [Vibrio scophthalmi]|nr:hypothetical protein [Vibrio scophthalmi]MCY9805920.1 hypothetical protein [Vibrio scophthalmi]